MTIITGAAISSFRQHGKHLCKVKQEGKTETHDWNDEVELICSYNLAAGEDVPGALLEMSAVAVGSRCWRFLYAGTINPDRADGRELTPVEAESAAWKLLASLGFSANHQWFLQRHKKKGRIHYHVCANRVDPVTLKAVGLNWNYPKQEQAARELETLFDLRPTPGIFAGRKKGKNGRFDGERPVAVMSKNDYQQSERTQIPVEFVIRDLRQIWAGLTTSTRSVSEVHGFGQMFAEQLRLAGYTLARGDKRDLVVVDWIGGVYSPVRRLGLKVAEFRQAIGAFDDSGLPSVDAVRVQIKKVAKAERDLDKSTKPLPLPQQTGGLLEPERNSRHSGGPR